MKQGKLGTVAIVLIVIASVIVLSVLWVAGSYNGLVRSDEDVNNKWANVQSAYQRRADLIPNLVETVKGYASHEEEVLTAITNARSKIGSAQTPSEYADADAELSSALSRLLVVVENYPNLKANENFLSLQDELAGTENRIKTERDLYNNAVRGYNVKVRRFPTNIIAGMFSFEKREMFEAESGAETAPKVDF
ncbi:LemA family protein [Candidatus Woesearchaeota archaeon]|nr:LemA family protein [Candidatus Woesearchaeota archaeon]